MFRSVLRSKYLGFGLAVLVMTLAASIKLNAAVAEYMLLGICSIVSGRKLYGTWKATKIALNIDMWSAGLLLTLGCLIFLTYPKGVTGLLGFFVILFTLVLLAAIVAAGVEWDDWFPSFPDTGDVIVDALWGKQKDPLDPDAGRENSLLGLPRIVLVEFGLATVILLITGLSVVISGAGSAASGPAFVAGPTAATSAAVTSGSSTSPSPSTSASVVLTPGPSVSVASASPTTPSASADTCNAPAMTAVSVTRGFSPGHVELCSNGKWVPWPDQTTTSVDITATGQDATKYVFYEVLYKGATVTIRVTP